MDAQVECAAIDGRDVVIRRVSTRQGMLFMLYTTVLTEEGEEKVVHFRVDVISWAYNMYRRDNHLTMGVIYIRDMDGDPTIPTPPIIQACYDVVLRIEELYGPPLDGEDVFYFIRRVRE